MLRQELTTKFVNKVLKTYSKIGKLEKNTILTSHCFRIGDFNVVR